MARRFRLLITAICATYYYNSAYLLLQFTSRDPAIFTEKGARICILTPFSVYVKAFIATFRYNILFPFFPVLHFCVVINFVIRLESVILFYLLVLNAETAHLCFASSLSVQIYKIFGRIASILAISFLALCRNGVHQICI